MKSDLDKSAIVEACVPEGMFAPAVRPRARQSPGRGTGSETAAETRIGRLTLLDLLMWALCFGLGTLVGSQFLPGLL